MKRLAIAAFVAALMVAPFTAQADDIDDGQDCRDGNAAPVAAGAASGQDADRGSFCVHAEGTTVFYLGGESQAEEPENQGTGGTCGAVIIMDTTVAGEDDWENDGADETPNTADDEHCD